MVRRVLVLTAFSIFQLVTQTLYYFEVYPLSRPSASYSQIVEVENYFQQSHREGLIGIDVEKSLFAPTISKRDS